MKVKKHMTSAKLLLVSVALTGSGSLIALSPSANGTRNSQKSHRVEKLNPLGIAPQPLQVPAEWKGLIGKYGPDNNVIYVLENDGQLNIQVKSSEADPLKQISVNIFRSPAHGPYKGETAAFIRGTRDHATAVIIDGAVFPRRSPRLDGEVFQPLSSKAVAELRRNALAAHPPVQTGEFLPADLVDVRMYDPTIRLDIRYATSHNFLGAPVYRQARAFLQRPAAEALARASKKLHPFGYGLLIHDAYRPWYVTKMFWDATPDNQKIFVANPAEGSRHNRGCAVDLTLYDLNMGKSVEMTGHYDEMSERSYALYSGGTSLERWRRDLLRKAMESEGFTVYPFEWWHFDYQNWKKYPILNLTFEQLSHLASEIPQTHQRPAIQKRLPARGFDTKKGNL